MKYKCIKAVLTGLLTAGLCLGAVTLSPGAAEAENKALADAAAEIENGVEPEDTAAENGAEPVDAAAENGAEPVDVAAGDGVGPGDGVMQAEEQRPVLPAGGIGAELQFAYVDGAPGEQEAELPAGEAQALALPAGEEQGNSEYADLAIAEVKSNVNVRSGPDTGSAIVGKIGNGAVAHVLETVAGEDGDWFRVVSGNVEGYMKAEFFLYGEAAAEVIDNYVTRYAVVLASRLNVRKEPGLEAKRIGYLDKGERVEILENLGDWLKVQYAGEESGYVAAEYVTVAEEFVYAKTTEEIAAEKAARKAMEQRRAAPEEQTAENTAITVTPPSGDYSTNAELRSEIINYAMQFVGNRYISGGRSLETGTDCSGFTSLIYAQFGYSLSRTPGGQLSGAGRTVSYSEAQPGDIVCYGSGRCTHVALYIGDGMIIHSANPRKGVVTQEANFDNIMGVKNVID